MISEDSIYWPVALPAPLSTGRRRRVMPQSVNTGWESRRLRIRRQATAALKLMEVAWNFTEDQYEDFRAFFIDQINQGEGSFVIETEEPDGVPGLVRIYSREVAFFEGSYQFSASDNLVTVTAVLEIIEEEYLIRQPFLVLPNSGIGDYLQFTTVDGEDLHVLYE